jgi:hypothetical protein
MPCVLHSVLSLHCCVYELLGGLLELLLRRLRVRARHTRLVFYLDVDWLPLSVLLLALSTLVTPVHGVVHHAPVERIVRLLLIFVSGNDGPSDDAEGARVLGLPLLLQLGTTLDWTGHCVILLSGYNATR